MKRYALEKLIQWKNNPNKKPLILRGARQVGKTWLMEEFGKICFKNVAKINFVDTPNAAKIFEKDYNLKNILADISIFTETKIIPGETLIILDEIQECDRALNSLKFFKENAPEYSIISAGSLLGIAVRKKHISFPVGQVEFLDLYPMSFCEFLDAYGEELLSEAIFNKNFPVLELMQDKCTELLKKYLFIGGMPEAVDYFLKNNDFYGVRKIQNQILFGYQEDFSKYTTASEVSKITTVWDSIPTQLAKENKKFSLSKIGKSARLREYESSIQWLILCGMVYKIPRISKPDLPIGGYFNDDAFKLYIIDVGLLGAKSKLSAKTILEESLIFEEFKGSLTEQFVLQELKLIEDGAVGYWSNDKSTAELDFIIQLSENIIPIEVKSKTNLRAKSLHQYREKFLPSKSIRTSLAPFKIDNGLYNIPLYMIENLKLILEED